MEFLHQIGIDISKNTLDCCLLSAQVGQEEKQILNQEKVIIRYLRSLFKSHQFEKQQVIICAEYTGRYIYPLVQACKKEGYQLSLVGGAEIKLASGLQRGKNDTVDALRIAQYAKRFMDKITLYEAPSDILEQVKDLHGERKLYVNHRKQYKKQLKDLKDFMSPKSYQVRKKRLLANIKHLNKQIAQIEREIIKLLQQDQQLARQYEILNSIKGVGPQTAIAVIIATDGFVKFTNPRKFACQAGVAPFQHQSGSSLKSRNRVSQRADKELKTLLHLSALSAVRNEGELRDYYLRKVDEGKNKMAVLNAVRAKLIHRMFALVRDDRTYQPKYENSYAA